MTTTRDILRKLGVINTYDLLTKFAPDKRRALAIRYHPTEHRSVRPARATVWSPHFNTDTDSRSWSWHIDQGKKAFTGKRQHSIAKAIEWASKQYGINAWGPCPTDPQTKIPQAVRDAALAAVKAYKKAHPTARTQRLKVYGWQGFRSKCPPAANGSKQTREICAAPSKAAVLRIMAHTPHQGRPKAAELCETGNDKEIAVAMLKPNTVFWRPLDDRGGTEGYWREGETAKEPTDGNA